MKNYTDTQYSPLRGRFLALLEVGINKLNRQRFYYKCITKQTIGQLPFTELPDCYLTHHINRSINPHPYVLSNLVVIRGNTGSKTVGIYFIQMV